MLGIGFVVLIHEISKADVMRRPRVLEASFESCLVFGDSVFPAT